MALIFSFWFQLLFWTKHAAHHERAVFEESGTGVDFDPLDVALGSRYERLAGAHESALKRGSSPCAHTTLDAFGYECRAMTASRFKMHA